MTDQLATREWRRIDLALQGGGSHGAFTWGVLDRLLEDGRFEIEAISGTSAGAMNAAVMAAGYVDGEADGARAALAAFWKAVADLGSFSPMRASPWPFLKASYSPLDAMARMLSPYDFNPLNFNPLLDLIRRTVPFDKVKSCNCVKVFVPATNVHTGQARVFTTHEISPEVLMASAALPQFYQAVMIDGQDYWDGGYMGNPVLMPMVEACTALDIVIVQINPLVRPGVPKTAREIDDRINEVTFNASLQHELRAIEFVNRLIDMGKLDGDDYRRVFLHRIEDEATLNPLGASSKLNADWDFLTFLRDRGRDAAARWIDATWDALDHRSTLDVPNPYRAPELKMAAE